MYDSSLLDKVMSCTVVFVFDEFSRTICGGRYRRLALAATDNFDAEMINCDRFSSLILIFVRGSVEIFSLPVGEKIRPTLTKND